MKLTGHNTKKLTAKQRKKKERTLKDMTKTRKEDSIQLRQKLVQTLQDYKKQYADNNKMEQQFARELNIAQENKLKLIGAISAIQKALGI